MPRPETERILRTIANGAARDEGQTSSPNRGEGSEFSCEQNIQRSVAPQNAQILVLAAHPDDETIGASAALGRVPGAVVVYLTDGAPRDPQFRSPHVSGSRELYACVRAEEAASALAFANIPGERIIFLSAIDQEAIFQAAGLVDELVPIIREFRPSIIITHPYEGGHPDHDTAALVARLGVQIAVRESAHVPEVVEMTSYHALDGKRVTGQLLSSPPLIAGTTDPALELKLSPAERTRKARMLGCYVSQWHVLSDFPLEPEQLRPAPLYDFTRPPHQGLLWYETLGWALTSARWCELAGKVLADFGEFACH